MVVFSAIHGGSLFTLLFEGSVQEIYCMKVQDFNVMMCEGYRQNQDLQDLWIFGIMEIARFSRDGEGVVIYFSRAC